MNINEYIDYITACDPDEKPLDRIAEDGGLTSIFRTVAAVGDSLSSGEFQARNAADTAYTFHDMYEYSWGQYMARTAGCEVYNFSIGGMTAKEYVTNFGLKRGFFNIKRAAQAYIIALGANDINRDIPMGTADDMWDGNTEHESTFAGYYNAIIERYKAIQPDAKFFLVSMPRDLTSPPEKEEKRKILSALLHDMAKKHTNTYVIDLYKYMPAVDEDYKKKFFLSGHLNPMGYRFMSKVFMSYIDYIIRHNYEDFIQVPFIGEGTHHYGAKW